MRRFGPYSGTYTSLRCGVALSAVVLSGTAFAQDGSTAAEEQQPAARDDIVVTGTLIRGIAPAGANVIGLSEEQAEASGGTTTNTILSSLPQVGNFFGLVPAGVSGVSGANASNPISRPNLRNLPAANTSGGAQTLVLLDGHRIVGAGTQQIAVDPDIFAPGVLQKVEAMTDGGSAIYGSDALGGVLNFITKRSFNGVEVNARYGFGDEYHSIDGSIVAGRDWGSGSAYIAYGYSHHDAIFGSDRDYVKRINWDTGVPVGRNCANPNISIGAASFVVSGASLVAGGPNVCDPSQDNAIYPEATLHNAFAKLTQELNDSITFEVSALYANRETIGNGGTLGAIGSTTGTVTVTSANPNYRDTGGATSGQPQTVRFNYGPVDGFRSNTQRTTLETWSVAPSFTIALGGDWAARPLFSYGHSKVTYRNNLINPAAQAAALRSGALNPYDVASSDPAAIAAIVSGLEQGYGDNELFDYRLVFDGPLFAIPGGDVRVALGAEYMVSNFQRRASNAALVLPPQVDYRQTVKSAFGEVVVPLVSSENASSMLHELTFSASGRYDEYDDFGDTFNPKFALTYMPADWISFRANWGTSFNAPTPVDQLGPLTASANLVPGAFLQAPPGQSFVAGETGIFLGNGSVTGLQPQEAETWSIGTTIEPAILNGFRFSVSYYHIDLDGTIGRPVSGTGLSQFYANQPDLWRFRPSGQDVAGVLAGLQNPGNIGFTLLNPTSTGQAQVSSAGGTQLVGVILDTLTRNLGKTKLSGIDFDVSYQTETGFGSIDASFAGNYRLTQDTRVSPTAPVVDELATEESRLRFLTTLGANIDNLRAQVSWYHVSGYDRGDAGMPSSFGQDRVSDFNIFNLFLKYDMNGSGVASDLSFTANVQNIFDTDPPVYKNSGQEGYDPSKFFTLGRVFQIGVQKKF